MAEPAQTSPARWGDLGLRVGSALVLIPAVLAIVWAGGIWFQAFVALLAVLMAHEWSALTHGRNDLQFALHAAAGLAGALLTVNVGPGTALIAIAIIWLFAIIATRMLNPVPSTWCYLGVPYVGVPALALVLLRADPVYGLSAIVWVMVTVWSADTLAYFAGRIIGGPKLAPRISPKKTWAGLGGAVSGSAIASLIFCAVAGYGGALILAVLAGLLAIVEQGGDLFKSAWKRFHSVKDSGDLIPGHGGAIDRIDGLIAVATAAALIGWLRGGTEATAMGLLVW
jgi:phosphatidate cytidylyltransferase